MKKQLFIFLFGILLLSCTSSKINRSGTSKTLVNASLTETYWKLIELKGQPILTNNTKQEMHIIFKQDTQRVSGHGGCNGFMGTYKLEEGTNAISFSQMASTLMACINMERETEFIKTLQLSDNFSIKGNILSLHNVKMATLEKFEAFPLKK